MAQNVNFLCDLYNFSKIINVKNKTVSSDFKTLYMSITPIDFYCGWYMWYFGYFAITFNLHATFIMITSTNINLKETNSLLLIDRHVLFEKFIFLNIHTIVRSLVTIYLFLSLLKEVESAVDIYHRYHWENYWFDNLKAVCEFLNLEFKNTTFVPNATTGKYTDSPKGNFSTELFNASMAVLYPRPAWSDFVGRRIPDNFTWITFMV